MPDEYVKLTEKGWAGMNKANNQRNLDIPDIVFSEHQDNLVYKKQAHKHQSKPKCSKNANLLSQL